MSDTKHGNNILVHYVTGHIDHILPYVFIQQIVHFERVMWIDRCLISLR